MKPDIPPIYDDTADFTKYNYNKGHAPVPHNKHDHHHIDTTPHDMTYWEQRISGLSRLLVEKGIITLDEMRRSIEEDQSRNIALGARVVARAWVDPEFKKRLLEDAREASKEVGVQMETTDLVAYEQTDEVHWVVVCTLCSCYPRNLIGLPPDWYKSRAYRSRAVREPRAVLVEFGLELPESVTIRVHDSTADMRYMVLPRRPEGAENLGEEELAALVTRDCMIGVAVPRAEAVAS